jgi:hypothetical protein
MYDLTRHLHFQNTTEWVNRIVLGDRDDELTI